MAKRKSRQTGNDWPPGLGTFDPAEWLDESDSEDLRLRKARARWVDARQEWQAANGYPFMSEFIQDLGEPGW